LRQGRLSETDYERSDMRRMTVTWVLFVMASSIGHATRANRESTVLTAAVTDSRPNRTKIIHALLDAGAEVDRGRKDGATALHEAAETGQVDIINLLVARGANVSAETDKGDTPAITAARHGQLAALRCLGELGADLDHHNAEGATARTLITEMVAALPVDGKS
jgi:ankyrin repeat protein